MLSGLLLTKDLLDSLEHTELRSALGWDGDVVDLVLVQVRDVADSRPLLELLDAAHDLDLLSVVADPNGQRRAPVAVATHGPVARVGQPVVEALLLHELGNPVRLSVGSKKLTLDLLHAHEPRGNGLVDERSLAAPAD